MLGDIFSKLFASRPLTPDEIAAKARRKRLLTASEFTRLREEMRLMKNAQAGTFVQYTLAPKDAAKIFDDIEEGVRMGTIRISFDPEFLESETAVFAALNAKVKSINATFQASDAPGYIRGRGANGVIFKHDTPDSIRRQHADFENALRVAAAERDWRTQTHALMNFETPRA